MCRSPKIWLRWLMLKTVHWRQFGHATVDLIRTDDRGSARSKLLISLSKLNVSAIYDILDDLIRFPPY